jgi:hypothetical protein
LFCEKPCKAFGTPVLPAGAFAPFAPGNPCAKAASQKPMNAIAANAQQAADRFLWFISR